MFDVEKLVSSYDKILYNRIKNGSSIKETIEQFETIRKSCIDRKTYIDVSFRYLTNNWNFIDVSKRSNTLYVMFLTKRIKDMKWLLDNKHKFNLSEDKLYNMLKLRDMLNGKK